MKKEIVIRGKDRGENFLTEIKIFFCFFDCKLSFGSFLGTCPTPTHFHRIVFHVENELELIRFANIFGLDLQMSLGVGNDVENLFIVALV